MQEGEKGILGKEKGFPISRCRVSARDGADPNPNLFLKLSHREINIYIHTHI